MIKEGFQPAFSALTFPTVITATSLKMAQGLLQLPFLTALVWLETLLLSLDFSRCLRWLCGLSQRVGRHPFH